MLLELKIPMKRSRYKVNMPNQKLEKSFEILSPCSEIFARAYYVNKNKVPSAYVCLLLNHVRTTVNIEVKSRMTIF